MALLVSEDVARSAVSDAIKKARWRKIEEQYLVEEAINRMRKNA